MYNRLLADVKEIEVPHVAPDRDHVYHLYMIKTPYRDEMREFLGSLGIPTVINYSRALPFYKAYEYLGHVPEDFPRAQRNQGQILSLPIFPEIKEEQQMYVVEKLKEGLDKMA